MAKKRSKKAQSSARSKTERRPEQAKIAEEYHPEWQGIEARAQEEIAEGAPPEKVWRAEALAQFHARLEVLSDLANALATGWHRPRRPTP
jgi:hypothetical protein